MEEDLERLIRDRGPYKIFAHAYRQSEILIFDLSKENQELASIINSDVKVKDDYVKSKIRSAKAKLGVGRYLEDRSVYEWSSKFGNRSIHLGMDLFLPAGTEVFAFMDCVVHSFKDNSDDGDYGPTIILKHAINDVPFYSLYGHLSKNSLKGKTRGAIIRKGEMIGRIGDIRENGSWPEHLHFQLLRDMQGREGDFPGVASREDLEEYKKVCIDPNLVVGITEL